MGSSAGGYTALAALAFTPSFRAGAISYGVADLAQLAKDTHKFEAHYLDKLVGPYPEAAQIYRDRSPLFHADQISAPIIFFQGDEDKIVPPSQTESMVGALRKNGIPTELIIFKGEQHGFRKAEHRIKVLEAQKAFFLSALQRNH
jgi:dipeptidyl aminopeptidase/acylaminoacyl peptidase